VCVIPYLRTAGRSVILTNVGTVFATIWANVSLEVTTQLAQPLTHATLLEFVTQQQEIVALPYNKTVNYALPLITLLVEYGCVMLGLVWQDVHKLVCVETVSKNKEKNVMMEW